MTISRAMIGKEIQMPGKKPKLGSGKRFKALKKKTGSAALAAWIGRNKYGKNKFAELSKKGRRRKAKAATGGLVRERVAQAMEGLE